MKLHSIVTEAYIIVADDDENFHHIQGITHLRTRRPCGTQTTYFGQCIGKEVWVVDLLVNTKEEEFARKLSGIPIGCDGYKYYGQGFWSLMQQLKKKYPTARPRYYFPNTIQDTFFGLKPPRFIDRGYRHA